jgi:hypothetical protein
MNKRSNLSRREGYGVVVNGRDHLTNGDKKRKRPSISEKRRVRVSFRRENGYRDSGVAGFTSEEDYAEDEDADIDDDFPSNHFSGSNKNLDQLRALLEKVSRDRLTTAILKICSSNVLVATWMKRELQKPEITKNISTTGESSLITPLSPKRLDSGRPEPISTSVSCPKCEKRFDSSGERRAGECQWHDGM